MWFTRWGLHRLRLSIGPRGAQIVELAGLPGSGKSTVCQSLRGNISAASGWAEWAKRRKYIRVLFLVPALLRFGCVLRAFLVRRSGDLGRACWRWITAVWRGESRSVQQGVILSLRRAIGLLCLLEIEYWLIRIETLFYRRSVLWDEGFVQRGISLWLRAPVQVRDDVWFKYLGCVPKRVVCVVLACDPSVAVVRAMQRVQGFPAIILTSTGGVLSRVEELYSKMAGLLSDRKLQEVVRCVYIECTVAGVVETVTKLSGELAGRTNHLPVLFTRGLTTGSIGGPTEA